MADRSVSVRLRLRISEFEAGANGVKKNLTGLNKKFAETAGFAKGFRRQLEDATKKLPKIEIDANSKPADIKIAELRSKLEELSKKEIGVDIDASQALVEMATLQRELEAVEAGASFDVRADIGKALADLNAINQEVQRLDGQKVELDIEADRTFAERLRAQVELAARSLPKIQIDADSTPAQVRIAELRAALVSLADKKIGVDVDSSAALAQIAAIERELAALSTSNEIDIRANAASALTELRSISSEVDRVDGRTANVNVNADVGSALSGIAMVGAALTSLPVATTIAVGVGAMGAAFTAAGVGAAGFAAAAVPAMSRINEALKEQESAAGGAGGATKSAAQSAAEAASRALQLEQAERRVTDAQKDVRQAQEDLTRARIDAKRANEDLALSVRDAALAEEDAALSVEEAAQRLAEVRADPESTDLEIRRAELAHRQAMARLDEQEVRTKRLQEDKAAADKAGVEGSDQVRSAQDKLLKAQDDLATAQKQLTVLQLQQRAAMQQTGGAAGGAASKFADLSKAEKALAKDVKSFQDSYVKWQRSLQPDIFPVIRSGMDVMRTGMALSTPVIKASAGAFNEFLKSLNSELKTQEWTDFFDDLAETAPGVIDDLGDSAINVASGLRGIVDAFLPYADDMTSKVEDLTQGFEDWGEGLKGSPEFERFIQYAQENGPKVVEIVKNIAEFVGKVADVGAGIGPGVLDFLVTLSDELAGMSPQQIQAIAEGVGLIFAAAKLGTSLKLGALVLLAQVLDDMSPEQIKALAVAIGLTVAAVKGYQAVSGAASWFQGLAGGVDKAGKAAGGASGKLSALGGAFGKGGLIAAAVVGTAVAMDQLGDAVYGLNPNIDELGKQLANFGSGGAPAAELLDQLGPKLAGVSAGVETFGDSAARLASDNPFYEVGNGISAFIDSFDLITIDNGAQSIGNLDQALATMVANGQGDQAAGAFNRLAAQAAAAGTPVDKLKELFPEYAASLDGSIPRTADMATAMGTLKVEVDPTALAMQSLNENLDTYNAKTDAAQLTLELRDAFNEAKSAINEAGGRLDFSAQMTDKQRDAVIKARDQFAGYIEKVQDAAKAAGEMAGKTGDAAVKSDEARDAVLRQLPSLGELAGKSGEARESVLKLAEAYGISRADAEKAMKGASDFQEVLKKFENKPIYVRLGLDTDAAIQSFENFVKKVGDRQLAVSLTAKQNMPARSGGIFAYAAGGLQAFAAGGRSTPPNIAQRPTILYGEGADQEAFIPYEAKFRDRAIGLLAQVANDFGLQLNNQQAAEGLTDLSVTIDDSGLMISDQLTGVMGSLQSTMGQAGTLTSSISKVGSSADQLNQSWVAGSDVLSGSVTSLSSATTDGTSAISSSLDALSSKITSLESTVKSLSSAVSAAKSAASSSAAKTSSTSSSAATGHELTQGTIPRSGAVSGSLTKGTLPIGGLIEGYYPERAGDIVAYASGGRSTPPGIASAATILMGEGRDREAFVPYERQYRARAEGLMSQVASDFGGAYVPNRSRVSAPQPMPRYMSAGPALADTSGGGSGGGSGSGPGRTAPLVNVENLQVRERADADLVASYLSARIDSKGF